MALWRLKFGLTLQMVYSDYVKLRILHYHFKGFTAYTIVKCLMKYDDIKVSIVGVWKFLKHYKETGSIARKPGSGRLSKVTSSVKELVEELMQNDDETTATQIHTFLLSKGINISLKTILRCRKSLGWTFRGSSYCQLIREENKAKRLAWVLVNQHDDFEDVIWTDESSIQLENHRRFCCRKEGQRPKPKPR